ncbi:response regulator transcription factor [Alkaliphilus sp. B6464]|uniref:response regulator transcription factor n=1 Tax=Alkaliphilus sp. B6464 TaxID=2731219 RepID=UPI001BAA9B02|nr:response regulator transcription factor [Alkaliphilus sp. B6464]QUH19469.1 response regulator transcription factor [Alkaliphilus sp. B6464]
MDIQILVVEDDMHICNMVAKFLIKTGYFVDICSDGDEALEQLYNKNYHLIILDIMLPGMNGQELLKELRKMHDTPVLMMTALSDDINQLMSFSNEADDYVIKPFSMQILVKRVEALLRRSGAIRKEITLGKMTLYPESYSARYDCENIQLTPKEFDILALFVQYKGKIVTHETLIIKIWGYNFDGNEGIVHASIKKLRDKLPVNIIKTVKGVGYCLEDVSNEA